MQCSSNLGGPIWVPALILRSYTHTIHSPPHLAVQQILGCVQILHGLHAVQRIKTLRLLQQGPMEGLAVHAQVSVHAQEVGQKGSVHCFP